ncbi:hypothetical protein TBH_C1497 [Thiolapillus brandeum]|uniref:Uncharacterized protein n=1 Tax=Thiolapillus brandeum TaxID=1076588 RepID=A0A7U6GIR6_9GAMM|nr:hypothetical protein TBH_C1497 [Thiolapillus brandeum]
MGNTWVNRGASCPPSVHPHGRGEHVSDDWAGYFHHGSSPRAWGTRGWSVVSARLARFIPTGVGNTSLNSSIVIAVGGSSPRAWGTRLASCAWQHAERFIPTGVGNTVEVIGPRQINTVHPHGRGEHSMAPALPHNLNGSSPRAWGTHRAVVGEAEHARFIPTGVGNTNTSNCSSGFRSVHPHGRGEHQRPSRSMDRARGSSPRAWGTRYDHSYTETTDAVHPHGRGEHERPQISCAIRTGSSPRAWGTRRWRRPGQTGGRFIPTGVGNTPIGTPLMVSASVHPHGRGEHGLVLRSGHPLRGSSPRAWGTLHVWIFARNNARFIPTGVGNTLQNHVHCSGRAVHPHGRGEHALTYSGASLPAGSSPRAWGTHS